MASNAERTGGGRWRLAAWGIAALLLLLPLAAMQVSDEVAWTGADFIFAGVLIGGVGLLFELTVRMSRSHAYRAGIGFALAASVLIVWANGAVGMIGGEDDPFNLLFGGVILIALAGAAAARFAPAGMARAMAAAAAAQAIVAAIGFAADPRGALFSIAFAAPWLVAAWLFRTAARAGAS